MHMILTCICHRPLYHWSPIVPCAGVGPLERRVRSHSQRNRSPYPRGNEYIEMTLLRANAMVAMHKRGQGASRSADELTEGQIVATTPTKRDATATGMSNQTRTMKRMPTSLSANMEPA